MTVFLHGSSWLYSKIILHHLYTKYFVPSFSIFSESEVSTPSYPKQQQPLNELISPLLIMVSSCAQQNFWSDWEDAHATPSL